MKTKLYLLFFFVFPLFMSACRGDDPIPDPPVDGKRTVLVYMAADNSINPLASFTDGDLEELKAGMASIDNTSDMHLLVYIDTGFPRLIEIENKGGTVVETKIEIRAESLRRKRYSMMCLGILYIKRKVMV